MPVDPDGKLLPDTDRLTRFGKLMRSTSLDELPEFFKVLKGEMSLVDPRPLLVEGRDEYTPEQFHRHKVLPSTTGGLQVNGRYALLREQNFAPDPWYGNVTSCGWISLSCSRLSGNHSPVTGSTNPELFPCRSVLPQTHSQTGVAHE